MTATRLVRRVASLFSDISQLHKEATAAALSHSPDKVTFKTIDHYRNVRHADMLRAFIAFLPVHDILNIEHTVKEAHSVPIHEITADHITLHCTIDGIQDYVASVMRTNGASREELRQHENNFARIWVYAMNHVEDSHQLVEILRDRDITDYHEIKQIMAEMKNTGIHSLGSGVL